MSADAQAAQTRDTDALIERCLRGDQAAWEDIVRLYRRRVFNIAYKFVGCKGGESFLRAKHSGSHLIALLHPSTTPTFKANLFRAARKV
jgi:hypothetical protein